MTARRISDAASRGIPLLGICLGSQLIAKALGSRVYPNAAAEIGWASVRRTAAALDDRLFGGLTAPEQIFHWYNETFELPR
ncbi:MAG: gamma-glutamyl-gamma-aminobutyrate hydrolase family protein, partial [Bryobacteraceae bacterium]